MCEVISDTARLLNELGKDKMGKHRFISQISLKIEKFLIYQSSFQEIF